MEEKRREKEFQLAERKLAFEERAMLLKYELEKERLEMEKKVNNKD